jgi:hypothetical protein
MPYPEDKIRFKHYGKGVENLVGKAVEMEDGEEKEALILSIANLMKKHYLSWSRNAVDDRIIWLDLNKIARGKLSFDETTPLISTKEIATRNDVNGNTHSNKKGKKKKRKPYKKKKY